LFFGHRDGSIRILNAETGAEQRYFKPHSSLLVDLALSPDGSYLVSGALDGTVYMSDVEVLGLIDYACTRLLWDFTPDERTEYGIQHETVSCPQFGATT
jgi:WD40 repeat protein